MAKGQIGLRIFQLSMILFGGTMALGISVPVQILGGLIVVGAFLWLIGV